MPDIIAHPHKALGLTCRQADVVVAIYEHLAEHGYSPTLAELARDLEIPCGRTGAHHHIWDLAEKGWVEMLKGKGSRIIRLKGIRMIPTFDDTPEAQRLRSLLEDATDVPS